MKVARLRRQWLMSVVLYTGAGLLSSVVVGAGLGSVGALFDVLVGGRGRWLLALLVGCLGVAELLGVRQIPLLQWRRQTPEFWRFQVPMPVTATLWGLDLGLVFTTWLTYPGPWFIATLALASGAPKYGALFFGAHWLGRAAWVWFAAYLLPTATSAPATALAILRSAPVLRRVHLMGIVVGVVAVGFVMVGRW